MTWQRARVEQSVIHSVIRGCEERDGMIGRLLVRTLEVGQSKSCFFSEELLIWVIGESFFLSQPIIILTIKIQEYNPRNTH